jgi:hypothetical protein
MAATMRLPIDGKARRHCAIASAAIVGFAAVLVLCVHGSTAPARGHGPVIAACHTSITWTGALPGTPTGLGQTSRAPLHGTFWVGVLSLASGVAVVQLAGFLRTVRIGSRCGH